jgi:hypothetical protein
MEPSTSYYRNLSMLLKDRVFTMAEANRFASILTTKAREKEKKERMLKVNEMVNKHCT